MIPRVSRNCCARFRSTAAEHAHNALRSECLAGADVVKGNRQHIATVRNLIPRLFGALHDRVCEEEPDLVPSILSAATYLCDESLQIGTTHFFGAPWTPGYGGWAFSRSLNALSYHWAQIPETTNVLITHGAPLGLLDQNVRGEPLGDPTLARAVQSLRPQVHVFGHIHESHGQREVDGITFVNASSCTVNYSPTNRPIVIGLA